MPLLLMYIMVLIGACLHPDPLVGMFILMGGMLAAMVVVMIPILIYGMIMRPKWEAAEEARWKAKYPNTKSLAEFMKELDDKCDKP